MNDLLYCLAALAGILTGFLAHPIVLRAWHSATQAYHTWKAGACYRYTPRATRETIDGLDSRYCSRCGKAAFEHYWTFR